MKTHFVNLTPYPITIGGRPPIQPSGAVARLNAQTIQTAQIDGIPILETVFNGVTGVPNKKANYMFIVPTVVRQAFPTRRDLLSPAKLVRDKNGMVLGCLGLEINPEIKEGQFTEGYDVEAGGYE
jgi:hypothetical protein